MISNKLIINEIPYLTDQNGRILIEDNKIYRIIEGEKNINIYQELLHANDIEDLFSNGLIRTKIIEELNIDSTPIMILEHKKIPFILHPCEYSNKMFWQAAYMFIGLNLKLCRKGFVTHDSHPWNVSFDGNKPIFFDFCSIIKNNNVNKSWLDGFFQGFIVPIWLSSFSKKTYNHSKEYRREHESGFGLNMFKSKIIKKIIFRQYNNLYKLNNNPEKLFNKILNWLDNNKPISAHPQKWSNYYKSTEIDYKTPTTIKQKTIFNILSDLKPRTVVDLASNKGYYSCMAAELGALVLAFDYQEDIVNFILSIEHINNNITPAHMDFNRPTASFDIGLSWGDSFQRFKSDIVLALGLIHHICIAQNVPVYLFCETCKKYTDKAIILEFVDPADIHVNTWGKQTPKDYTIEKIKVFMAEKFSHYKISAKLQEDGLNRTFIYFYN